jgi:hypothetical protein
MVTQVYLCYTYTFDFATLAEGGATSGAATLGVINNFLKSSFVRAGLNNRNK